VSGFRCQVSGVRFQVSFGPSRYPAKVYEQLGVFA
jgi:hypothetical protein